MIDKFDTASTDIQDPRANMFRRLVPLLIAAAGLTIVFYGIYYLKSGIWQLLVEAGALGIAILFALIAQRFAHHQRYNAAGYWVLAGVAIAFAGNELAWTGATLYIAVGGVLMILLAGIMLVPKKWLYYVFMAALYLVVIALVAWQRPLPRFDISNSLILSLFIPGLTVLLILASFWQGFLRLRSSSIRNRLLVSFVFLVLVPILITGSVSSFSSAQSAQDRILNQLESVATLKEAEINSWLKNLQTNLSNLLSETDQVRLTSVILREEGIPGVIYEYSHEKLQDQLSHTLVRTHLYDEIFIMDLKGKVVVSTDKNQEGKNFYGQPLFQEGLKGKYIAPPLYAPSLQEYRIVVSEPVIDRQGKTVGVLAGRANMSTLDEIMLERTGLGRTGETYLVGTNHVLVTVLRSGEQYLTIRTDGANKALGNQTDGSGSYTNAKGEGVFGVYHWLPELQVALLAEQSRTEALGSVFTTLGIIIGVTLVLLLVAISAALFITRSIANPIGELANTSAQIAAGNLELTAKVGRNDEISALAGSFNIMTARIRELVSGLEQRVAERTHDLEHRTMQVQTAAEVARDITTTTNLDELLGQSVNLIRERFGFYHAGIFLVDKRGEFAILQAATGEAGRQLLAQEHKLKVGETGIVGYVTGTGKPRIALDVGVDAIHFRNPFLPETRSEMALPLRVGERIIGALDVQSTEAAAFTEEDVTILQIMADQLAVAIENARLIQQLNQTVQELEQAYGHYTHQAWRDFAHKSKKLSGYRYRHLDVQAVTEQREEAREALQQGRSVIVPAVQLEDQSGPDAVSALAIPIKLRGEVIGVLNMRFQGSSIPEETISFVEETASRLALVLENARLLEDARRLASREQQINLISTQIRSSVNVETILQNTVRELGKVLGASRSFIQISGEQLASLHSDESNNSSTPNQNGSNGTGQAGSSL